MSSYLTSSSLIDTVKREAMIPTSESTFTASDFLAIANQEMKIGIMPTVMEFHQEYCVVDSDLIPLLPNTNNYAIPYRAVGGKFREVFYKDTNGNLRSLTRISPDDRPYYQQSNFQNRFLYFFIEGNNVVLVPDVGPNPVGSLIFSYYMRPNELVDESRVSTVLSSSVVGSSTILTVDQIPSNLTPFLQGGTTITGFSTSAKMDILQRQPGHKTLSMDVFPTALDPVNLTITFNTSDLNASMVPGDYVAFSGESIIPQIPTDLHDMLSQRVVHRCVQALGDAQAVQMSGAKLAEMEKHTGFLIDNRSEGTPQKINNLRGLLRSAKIRKRGWV